MRASAADEAGFAAAAGGACGTAFAAGTGGGAGTAAAGTGGGGADTTTGKAAGAGGVAGSAAGATGAVGAAVELTTTGEEKPSPMVICQRGLVSAGKFVSTRSPAGTCPSRLGPRHCGQSAAFTHPAQAIAASDTAAAFIFMVAIHRALHSHPAH